VGADKIVEQTTGMVGIGGSRVEATTGGDGTVRHQRCHVLVKVVTSEKVR
jgi:hypothetical protein